VCNKIIDTDFKLKYMSTAGTNLLKITDIKKYYGKKFPPEFYPKSVRPKIREKLKAAMAGQTSLIEAPAITMEGNELWFHTTFVPVFDSKEQVDYVIATSVDITERLSAEQAGKLAEEQLKHRAGMERLIAQLSSNLLKRYFENIDVTIHEALSDIGTFSGVDRVYVFSLCDDTATMDNTHEWCAKGIEPQIDNLKDLPISIFPWWMDQLNHFKNIHIPRVSDLPKEANAEKEILQSQDIQSLIVVPMIVQSQLTGVYRF